MKQKRMVLATAALVILAALAIRFLGGSGNAKPPPSSSGYYAGPMRNKAGTAVVTENGTIVSTIPSGAGAADSRSGSAQSREGTSE